MSFPRYPAYKPSGVEWLGEVPEHWSVERFKLSIETCVNGVWGEEPGNGDNDVTCMRVADFDRQKLVAAEPDEPTIRSVSARDIEQRSLGKGDLLIEKSGGGEKQPVGAVVLYTGSAPAVCSNFVARMRLAQGMTPSFWRYAHHAAYSLKVNTKSIKQTSGIQNLDQQQYLDERAPFPPGGEQLAIATFLDRETAKIDALIAEQQRLIELLQEKRQAVISHAVAKGLNPDAPMKDSGVEWLGEVPEHWDNHRLKNLFALKHGYAFDGNHFSDEGLYALMTPGNFIETGGFRRKDPEKYYAANDVPSGFILREGQMLVAMTEQAPGLVGTALFVPKGQVYLHNQRLGLVTRLRSDILDTSFLYWLMNSPMLKAKAGISATGQKVRHSSPQKILENEICLPPLDEQRDIAQALFDSGERCNRLIDDSDQSIRLLQERRSALISAAVTGQIDVRGLVSEAEVF